MNAIQRTRGSVYHEKIGCAGACEGDLGPQGVRLVYVCGIDSPYGVTQAGMLVDICNSKRKYRFVVARAATSIYAMTCLLREVIINYSCCIDLPYTRGNK